MKGVGDSYNSVVNRNIVVYMRTAPTSHCQYLKQSVSILFGSDSRIIYKFVQGWERYCLYLGPGHVGIRGNSAADSAAKDALAGNVSDELIPFSDLKSHANKYILQLGQSEWDEFLDNKLHKIFPVSKECVICPWTNRKEETVIAHWPFFYYAVLFIEG